MEKKETPQTSSTNVSTPIASSNVETGGKKKRPSTSASTPAKTPVIQKEAPTIPPVQEKAQKKQKEQPEKKETTAPAQPKKSIVDKMSTPLTSSESAATTATPVNTQEPTGDERVQNMTKLLEYYQPVVNMIDHRNPMYYAALMQHLYVDFIIDDDNDDGGTIDKNTYEVGKIIEKACEKLKFNVYNATIPEIMKLFNAIVKKLGGTTAFRVHDLKALETLMFRMYSDAEVIEFLYYLYKHAIKPQDVLAINSDDEVLLRNGKSIRLQPSEKWEEFIEYMSEKD